MEYQVFGILANSWTGDRLIYCMYPMEQIKGLHGNGNDIVCLQTYNFSSVENMKNNVHVNSRVTMTSIDSTIPKTHWQTIIYILCSQATSQFNIKYEYYYHSPSFTHTPSLQTLHLSNTKHNRLFWKCRYFFIFCIFQSDFIISNCKFGFIFFWLHRTKRKIWKWKQKSNANVLQTFCLISFFFITFFNKANNLKLHFFSQFVSRSFDYVLC